MAKMYFYYSSMNAGKSTALLQSSYNYRERGMNTLVMAPELDDRYGVGKVTSRIGLESEAITFKPDEDLQAIINARLTKISAHTAVVTGILTALLLMGDLNSPFLITGAVGMVTATAWARVVTGHHTVLQVSLGIVVSMTSVFTAYGVMTLL